MSQSDYAEALYAILRQAGATNSDAAQAVRAILALKPEPAQQADKYTTLVNAGMPPSEAYRLAQQAPRFYEPYVCQGCKRNTAGSAEGAAGMKAGIVIDRWKLPIFTRRLKDSGFAYEEVGPLSEDTLTLIVNTNNAQALAQTILAANTEAAQSRKTK